MKKNAMRKNLRQSIMKSFGRYIAIVMIIALGSALFVGLLMTKADMVATGQAFMDRQNMFDLRLMNSFGWTQEQFQVIASMDGIEEAEPLYYMDLAASVDDQDGAVYRFISIPQKINLVALRGGRMPQAPNECLADGFFCDDSIIGSKVRILSDNEEDSLDAMTVREFTVVGYAATPLYMDMNRGTTSVGSGLLSQYFFVPQESMDMDYIPEICITVPGDYQIYTDTYHPAMDAFGDQIEPELQILANARLAQVKQEAEDAYLDGMREYSEGLMEYAKARHDAQKELAKAHKDLVDAEQEIADNEKKLIDGEAQLAAAKLQIAQGQQTLLQGKQALANAKAAAYQQISETKMAMLQQVEELTAQLTEIGAILEDYDFEFMELESAIAPLEASMLVLNSNIASLEGLIQTIDYTLDMLENGMGMDNPYFDFMPDISEDTIQYLIDTRNEYQAKLDELYAQRAELQAQLDELYAKRAQQNSVIAELRARAAEIEASLASLAEGLITIAATEMMMDDQFAAAEAQLQAGEAQLQAGALQIEMQERAIEEGWIALENAKKQVAEGWSEYEKAKAEAEEELADGLLEIQDAMDELKDAWKTIQKMTDNEVMILNRTSNVGYNNLESSSDIVQGVSRVLPVFFLLVASLVCITTMTRMVDEERTQIGTLKALGYSSQEIMSKYLFYSGSGAIIGCGFGVLVGSAVFPSILWDAYQILLYVQPNLVLTVNWLLCAIVVIVYTTVLMMVTWYCCRKALKEEPAELIRPKAPDPGKKIFMERLPIWNKISFLNKVTIRNIFRYRQRMAMMLVGIGGCTALLVTGFGLRDSIVNVVDYQFEEVTHFDMEVYFKEGVTPETKSDFREKLPAGSQSMFYYQTSVDISYDGQVKEIFMICADDQVMDFIDMHRGEDKIEMPGQNEIVLSVGVSEMLGLDVGDTVHIRNSDLQSMDLVVSGIYDNHVYNYSLVTPQTIAGQWGIAPEQQMAFVTVPEGNDIHALSAELTSMIDVMNVTISEDMADMVRSMMEALDMVVVVVVFCAGLLAAIVLYNLTNININERIREIATIKVLGFRAGETGAYVFKENLTLTVLGSILGMGLGYLLLLFVMTQIKIDMVWFKTMVMPESYIGAVILTLLSALIVDFVFYFKLQSINMAEALKSVE
ncbi:MAG: FtsX-like permease family protein [Oscillospiraceae bacterium]|nr:FtsX-like permease family protein [Oscillospiraceae bacterium]